MCVTEGATYTATNGAIDTELNATNRGCLVANEATSSFWFRITFTSSGVFYMTIDPGGNNSNDYDFAIWSGTNCPPTTAPIRCSFAGIFPFGNATGANTGLAAGNTDTSESPTGNGWLAPLNVSNGQSIIINVNNYGNGSNNFTVDYGATTATMFCGTPLGEDDSFLEHIVENSLLILTGKSADDAYLRYSFIDHYEILGVVNNDFLLDIQNAKTGLYELVSMKGEVLDGVYVQMPVPHIVKVADVTGREVSMDYVGMKIVTYSDGTRKVIM